MVVPFARLPPASPGEHTKLVLRSTCQRSHPLAQSVSAGLAAGQPSSGNNCNAVRQRGAALTRDKQFMSDGRMKVTSPISNQINGGQKGDCENKVCLSNSSRVLGSNKCGVSESGDIDSNMAKSYLGNSDRNVHRYKKSCKKNLPMVKQNNASSRSLIPERTNPLLVENVSQNACARGTTEDSGSIMCESSHQESRPPNDDLVRDKILLESSMELTTASMELPTDPLDNDDFINESQCSIPTTISEKLMRFASMLKEKVPKTSQVQGKTQTHRLEETAKTTNKAIENDLSLTSSQFDEGACRTNDSEISSPLGKRSPLELHVVDQRIVLNKLPQEESRASAGSDVSEHPTTGSNSKSFIAGAESTNSGNKSDSINSAVRADDRKVHFVKGYKNESINLSNNKISKGKGERAVIHECPEAVFSKASHEVNERNAVPVHSRSSFQRNTSNSQSCVSETFRKNKIYPITQLDKTTRTMSNSILVPRERIPNAKVILSEPKLSKEHSKRAKKAKRRSKSRKPQNRESSKAIEKSNLFTANNPDLFKTRSKLAVKRVARDFSPRKKSLLHVYEYDSNGHRQSKIIIGKRKGSKRYRQLSPGEEDAGLERGIRIGKTKRKARTRRRLHGKRASTHMIAKLWKVVDTYGAKRKSPRQKVESPVAEETFPLYARPKQAVSDSQVLNVLGGRRPKALSAAKLGHVSFQDLTPLPWAQEGLSDHDDFSNLEEFNRKDDILTHLKLSLTTDPHLGPTYPKVPPMDPVSTGTEPGQILVDGLEQSTFYLSIRPRERMLHLSPPRVGASPRAARKKGKKKSAKKKHTPLQHYWNLSSLEKYLSKEEMANIEECSKRLSQGRPITKESGTSFDVNTNAQSKKCATSGVTGTKRLAKQRVGRKNSQRKSGTDVRAKVETRLKRATPSSALYDRIQEELRLAVEKVSVYNLEAHGTGDTVYHNSLKEKEAGKNSKLKLVSKSKTAKGKFENIDGQKRVKQNNYLPFALRSTQKSEVKCVLGGSQATDQSQRLGGQKAHERNGKAASGSASESQCQGHGGPVCRLSPALPATAAGVMSAAVERELSLSSLSLASADGESATLGCDNMKLAKPEDVNAPRKLPVVRFGATLDKRFRRHQGLSLSSPVKS